MSGANALELSDEEFLNQPASAFEEEAEKQEENTETVDEEPTEDVEASVEGVDSEAQEQPEQETEDEEVGQPEGDTQTEHEPETDSNEPESLDTGNSDEPDTEGDTPETNEFDYESAYKKVTSPFKANGVDMQVDSPEEAIKLMQMGANYHRKMAALKPNLKIVKMLESNGLLDEGKLNNLIDISKKNPAALAKLIKESGVDPLDIDTDKGDGYEPTDYSISDKEFELDNALESIKDSKTFDKTIQVMSKEWDQESKGIISDNPGIIEVIDIHMQNGVYDTVNAVVQKEKLLGNLQGVPDVVAYRQVAEYLASQGSLVESNQAQKPTESSEPEKKAETKQRSNKRKAAAPTKSRAPAKKESDDDFLGLSDEEFMKKFSAP